jgi:hypothetical protein
MRVRPRDAVDLRNVFEDVFGAVQETDRAVGPYFGMPGLRGRRFGQNDHRRSLVFFAESGRISERPATAGRIS